VTQCIQPEEKEFFEKRAKAVVEHTKKNKKLVQLIKDAHKADPSTLVKAKEYFEQDAGHKL